MHITIDQSRNETSLRLVDDLPVCGGQPPMVGLTTPIVTVGPAGSDAEAEARKYGPVVRLVASTDDAMALAAAYRVHALVGGGYRAPDHEATQSVDSWSTDHTPHAGVLRLRRFWESPAALMCLAVRRDFPRLATPRTVAIPPHAQHFAGQYVASARPVPTISKPASARMAAHGEVDACITSVAAAARYPILDPRIEWQPTMLWRLYGPADGTRG